ncbi:MAG: alpha/beta hydrolase family protein [Rhodanobacter sp.]
MLRPLVLVSVLYVAAMADAGAAPRRWAVRDSIELSMFMSPGLQYLEASQVRFSPDGAHFIAATMRGDPDSGRRVATIWLFDSRQVDAYLHDAGSRTFEGARPLLRTGSMSNRDPISNWGWSSDSRSVLYLAVDDGGVRRLYRADIAGGKPVALSRAEQDVSRFDERGGAIVYLAHRPVAASELYQTAGPSLPDIVEATGQNNLPLMFPNWIDAEFGRGTDELWRVEQGRPVAVPAVDRKSPVQLKDARLAQSSDGSKLLVTTFVHRIPRSWERYKPLVVYPGLQIVADTPETAGSTGYYRPKQYSLVDLERGSVSLLVDSPIDLIQSFEGTVTAAWSEDDARIALPGAYPPLADAPASGPIYPCTIAVVEIGSKAFSCLQPQKPIDMSKRPHARRKRLVALQWRRGGRELVAQFMAPAAPEGKTVTVYARDGGGRWVVKSEGGHAPSRKFAVEVKQALDEPPVLVAEGDKRISRVLLDPNPQLGDIARGTVALYRWHDADGELWDGALVKPPDFRSGRRYPLVIQTHNLDRAQFLVDGPSATGFAARALAARDMLVLQVDEIRKNFGAPGESEAGAAGYRAAIRQLSKEGLVDPGKVGIITWSHMGPYVYQGLIDQPGAYKAATISEADSGSYPEYLQNIDYMGTEREQMFRARLGGEKPFGKGLQAWLRNSPGFHFDRICTPVLMEFNSPVALQYGWDDYAALRAQGKPVDLLYIRNGDHELVQPLERLAEQGRNVDWYDYWLNGRRDPDPAKTARYRLWDAMKAALPVCPQDLPGIH